MSGQEMCGECGGMGTAWNGAPCVRCKGEGLLDGWSIEAELETFKDLRMQAEAKAHSAVARAERAEAVVRLLVETGGKCGATRAAGVHDGCVLPPSHDGWHRGTGWRPNTGWEWTDANPGATASPWTPGLLAALRDITEQGGESP
ncbi:hypothetical protein PO878_04085 [Iamia majanohamensis]|uniref:Uncharacterized protein n=1 Tax=Iamia majanohamensis TaxID=467976 RepID=A0AAE9Y7C8_9ACTN|nr:hypothetical protein [Iamia majanohamensis]WCO67902.1 hypothetical protein PO878_04085 [Iamia majanohamensis]